MQTLTDITEKTPGSGRYVVSLDGRPAGVLSAGAIAALGLHLGDTLGVNALDRLRDAFAEQGVFEKAVELLAVSARSTRELRRRLLRTGAGTPHVDEAIRRLTTLGYLNDADYADGLVRSRFAHGGASKRRVQQDLFRKGVARDVADEAIQRAVDDGRNDEHGAALEQARKRLGALRRLDPATRKRRLYGFLARRGYESLIIGAVLRELANELGSDTGETETELETDLGIGDEP